MTKIILTILFSLLLIVLGQYLFNDFYALITPNVDGVTYTVTNFNSQFFSSLIFSLALGIIPIALLFTWKFLKVSTVNKMLSAFIVLTCMALAVFIRQQVIKSYLKALAKSFAGASNNSVVSYPIDKANFEYYLLIGLFSGCLISFFIFPKREKL